MSVTEMFRLGRATGSVSARTNHRRFRGRQIRIRRKVSSAETVDESFNILVTATTIEEISLPFSSRSSVIRPARRAEPGAAESTAGAIAAAFPELRGLPPEVVDHIIEDSRRRN
jgi:hypothetical protein